MKVTSTGHAGLYLETAGGTILCDPLLYPTFFASWFVFPDNSGLPWEQLGDCDYLYVSHLHHDHFDAENLVRHVNKSATVLLPDFEVTALEDALRALGFHRFERLPNDTPVELDGMRVQITAVNSPNDGALGDSALSVDDGTAMLLNQNDARPSGHDALYAFAGDAGYDAHCLQFSGAVWYPMVYDFPAKTMHKAKVEKRENGMARALRYVEGLSPSFVFPTSGPPCFLDAALFEYNDFDRDPANVFPDATVFCDYLAEHGYDKARLLIPGSTADVHAADVASGRPEATCTVSHPIPQAEVDAIFTDKRTYLQAYAERQAGRIAREKATWADPDVDVFAELRTWFEPLLELSTKFVVGIGYPVEFTITGDPDAPDGDPRRDDESVVIDLPARRVRRPAEGEKCRYRIQGRPTHRRAPHRQPRGRLGEHAVPLDAFRRPSSRALQRVPVRVLQVSVRRAARVRRRVVRGTGSR